MNRNNVIVNTGEDLFTEDQISVLKSNGIMHQRDHDAVPCVLLTNKNQKFLISEICYGDEETAYGLSLNNNTLDIGFIKIETLLNYHKNTYLFNDERFVANYKLSVYKAVADEIGRFVHDEILFRKYFEKFSFK